eukprot:9209264-Alexandrium_andersonii.AAC.1
MSASLVGSEMCIRDSRRGAWGRMSWAFAAWAGHPLSRPPHGPRHHTPVSYTHLTLPTICSV